MDAAGFDADAADAAAAFQRLHPRAFFERFVDQGVRPDGRGLEEARPMRVERDAVRSADGSARVTLGDTSVVCGIRFAVGPPVGRKRDEGSISVSVRLLPVCSPAYDGRNQDQEASLAAFLVRVLEGGQVLDKSQLLIEEGVASFVLFADVVCLADDGNLADAALAALLAALLDLRLPKMAVQDVVAPGAGAGAGGRAIQHAMSTGREVVQVGEATPNRVRLSHTPVSTTFGIFGAAKQVLLVDPTHEELEVLDGTVSAVVDAHGNIFSLFKPDGPALDLEQLNGCFDLATARAQRLAPSFC